MYKVDNKVEFGYTLKVFYDTQTSEYVARTTDEEEIEGRGAEVITAIMELEIAYRK